MYGFSNISPTDFPVTCTTGYRFGFNGQEKVDEISGIGNHNTALFWEYDTRLGRRWNLDPKPDISKSSYSTFGNNPVIHSDILGDTIVIFLGNKDKDPALYLASQQMVKKSVNDGVFIVVSHANPLVLQVDKSSATNDFKHFTSDVIVPMLRAVSPEFNNAYEKKNIKSLILSGCNTATDPNEYYDYPEVAGEKMSLAEELSKDESINEVVGSTGYMRFGKKKDGTYGLVTISSKFSKNSDGTYLKSIPNDKSMVTFKKGKKITENEKGKGIETHQPYCNRNDENK